MATMTRERMKEIQREPKQATRWVLRTGQHTKDGILPYRDDLMERALNVGLDLLAAGIVVEWWRELAPLAPAERNEVRAQVTLRASKAA